MNSWIFVSFVSLFLAVLVIVDAGLSRTTVASPPKINDKPVYPKKVTSLKKRPLKTAGKLLALSLPKRTIDAFKNLPADDLEFIKELDKQFKLHGDNIKIKVKRDNTTSMKTSKRTVEGEMGYGHYNSYDTDYQSQYPKATFAFYPYSQEDIPGSAISHQGNYDKTTVTIEPSVSFELKQQQATAGGYDNDSPSSTYQQDYYSQGGAADVVHQQSPLIVLRIPGPSKYAAHLQSLLQQYLEIRARQYLKILEEAELQKSQQPQHEVAAPQPQYEYSHYDPPATQHQQQQVSYQEQQQPQHEDNYANYQQSHDNYPSVAEVYQKYKIRYQQQKLPEQQYYQERETPIEYSSAGMDPQIQPQYYYVPQHPQHAQHPEMPSHSYQSVYFIAMPAHQPSYAAQSSDHQQESSYPHQLVEQSAYGAPSSSLKQSDSPPISENNPRPTHTKVVFTHSTERTKNYSPTYPLPSIQPFDHHLPSSTPIYEKYQQQQQQQNYEPSQEIDYHRSEQQITTTNQHQQQEYQPSEEKVVSITQRPFNYHAHSVKNRARNNSKRDAFPVAKSNKKTIRNLKEDHIVEGVASLR